MCALKIKERFQKKNGINTLPFWLLPEFKTVRDCKGNEYVVFSDLSLNDGFDNRVFCDRTSFEATENHIHIAENVSGKDADKYRIMGKFLCEYYLNLLENSFPEKRFAVFFTVKERDSVILRFHQYWDGEPLYYQGEAFDDGTSIIQAHSK